MGQVESGHHAKVAMAFGVGIAVYSRLPPHVEDGYTSVSRPFAFGTSFTGHRDSVVRTEGERPATRTFAPGTVGLNGWRPMTWVRVAEPSEGLEIHPAPWVLEEVAAETGCDWRALDTFAQVGADPVVWGICARFRMAARGAAALEEPAAEELVLHVAMHAGVRYFGGRAPRAYTGRLDEDRLQRACAHLRENADRPVTLAELSWVAAMSPYHLQRTFKRSTGLSPAEFGMAIRMERAHRLLAEGCASREAAAAVGIRDLSYFRRCYRRSIGSGVPVYRGGVTEIGGCVSPWWRRR